MLYGLGTFSGGILGKGIILIGLDQNSFVGGVRSIGCLYGCHMTSIGHVMYAIGVNISTIFLVRLFGTIKGTINVMAIYTIFLGRYDRGI